MKENLIRDRSYQFALRVVSLYRVLVEQKKEFVLSKQMVRAGTSIGANVEEATAGQSRADFVSKMSIASKEVRECNYWLRLLKDAGYLTKGQVEPLLEESVALTRILTAIVKSTRENSNEKAARH
jgi:four helix bundle protein